MPRVLWWPQGVARFLMSEVPLYTFQVPHVQGYLAHKKQPLPWTLQKAHAWGHMMVLGGAAFLTSDAPLY